MQHGSSREAVHGPTSKPILLGLVTAIVIGVVAPLVVPHATHPFVIYHIILHVASLTIAAFLMIVAFISYFRAKPARLLLMALGFTSLAAVEFIYVLDASGMLLTLDISPAVNVELPHV